MAAGDLVVADWQVELRATLMGFNTNFVIDRMVGVGGLGWPVKVADTPFAHADGSFASEDYKGQRVITIPFIIRTGVASTAGDALETLLTAWAPSTTDLPLFMRFPGFGKFSVTGRPGPVNGGDTLDVDTAQWDRGLIRCLAMFRTTTDSDITYA